MSDLLALFVVRFKNQQIPRQADIRQLYETRSRNMLKKGGFDGLVDDEVGFDHICKSIETAHLCCLLVYRIGLKDESVLDTLFWNRLQG